MSFLFGSSFALGKRSGISFIFGALFELLFVLMCWRLFQVAEHWMMSYLLPPPPKEVKVALLFLYFGCFLFGFSLNVRRKSLLLPGVGLFFVAITFALTYDKVFLFAQSQNLEEGVSLFSGFPENPTPPLREFLRFLPGFVFCAVLSSILSPPKVRTLGA